VAKQNSFDVVARVDRQEVDNALNQARKELATRYDFKGTGAGIEWSGDAVVVSAPHEMKGAVPVAFVVAGGDLSADELRAFAREHGPAYAHPRRVFFVDGIPLTSTEKVDRDALEDEARRRIDGSL